MEYQKECCLYIIIANKSKNSITESADLLWIKLRIILHSLE